MIKYYCKGFRKNNAQSVEGWIFDGRKERRRQYMKRSLYISSITIVIVLLLIPVMVQAQSQQTTTKAPPPIEQPLVREGNFAVKLVFAFALGVTEDEVEAENLLSSAGITPLNGWIADYPVTPDIMGEIWGSIIDAVDSRKLSMDKDEALRRFQDAKVDVGLTIRAYTSGEPHEINASSAYPETSVINNYYYNQGPPIVTYYAPPPDYYYLYAWVPSPFWWYDFWFPGFFILNDFHRTVHFHQRYEFISNHFNDSRHHRVHRIDPIDRFHGRTFGGIGAPRSNKFIPTGVNKGSESIFNRNRTAPPPSRSKTIGPPSGGKKIIQPSGSRAVSPPSGGKNLSQPSGGRAISPPSGGKNLSQPSGSRAISPPSGGRASGPQPDGRTGPPDGSGRR